MKSIADKLSSRLEQVEKPKKMNHVRWEIEGQTIYIPLCDLNTEYFECKCTFQNFDSGLCVNEIDILICGELQRILQYKSDIGKDITASIVEYNIALDKTVYCLKIEFDSSYRRNFNLYSQYELIPTDFEINKESISNYPGSQSIFQPVIQTQEST